MWVFPPKLPPTAQSFPTEGNGYNFLPGTRLPERGHLFFHPILSPHSCSTNKMSLSAVDQKCRMEKATVKSYWQSTKVSNGRGYHQESMVMDLCESHPKFVACSRTPSSSCKYIGVCLFEHDRINPGTVVFVRECQFSQVKVLPAPSPDKPVVFTSSALSEVRFFC